MLIDFARRISAVIEPGDLLARLAGDEFAVLLPSVADPASALQVAERIMRNLGAPTAVAAHRLGIRASVGIALIEPGQAVIVIVPSPRDPNSLHPKVVSNIQEVRARGAFTVVLAEEGDDEVAPYADVLFTLPKVSTLLQPLVATVPLQMFACELATLKGYDVDQQIAEPIGPGGGGE